MCKGVVIHEVKSVASEEDMCNGGKVKPSSSIKTAVLKVARLQ